MLTKRIISCLDVRDGRLAKSVKFVDTRDIGDPVETARRYYAAGLDELVFYDITASSDGRDIMIDDSVPKEYEDIERYCTPAGMMMILR